MKRRPYLPVYVNSMSVACCLVVSPLQELEIVARRAPYLLVIEHFISQDSYLFLPTPPLRGAWVFRWTFLLFLLLLFHTFRDLFLLGT